MTKSMGGEEDVLFDFKIQVRDSEEDSGAKQKFIENATTTWDTASEKEVDAYVSFAKIVITVPQQINTAEAIAECEQFAFSPWHSLAAHQPVGASIG